MTRLEAIAASIIAAAVLVFLVVLAVSVFGSGDGDIPSLSGVPNNPRLQASPTPSPEVAAASRSPAPAESPAASQTLGPVEPLISWQGEERYLHGVNFPWYNWGCDFGCGSGSGITTASIRSEIEAAFADLQERGIQIVRWWMFPGHPWQVETDGDVPAGIDPKVYEDFDTALEMAEKYDLYYVFTLFSSPTRVPLEWMAEGDLRSRFVDALTPLFARHGDNPRVLSWQVFNEPEWHVWNGDVPEAPVRETVRDIAAAVHANSQALVSVGSAHIGGLTYWKGLGLDYYTAHWYDGMTSNTDCALCTDFAELQRRHRLDAPLVIGEFYAGGSVDVLARLRAWQEKGFAGAWAWSLFPDRTEDGMTIDLDDAAAFAAEQDTLTE